MHFLKDYLIKAGELLLLSFCFKFENLLLRRLVFPHHFVEFPHCFVVLFFLLIQQTVDGGNAKCALFGYALII
jgi:hypothetical protein